MSGDFAVTPGTILQIIVGGMGNPDPSSSGGGGGSGVNNAGTPLIVAGGGAGVDFQDPSYAGIHAVITNNGVVGNGAGGAGGTAGNDGGDNIYSSGGNHISRGGRGWNSGNSGSFGQNGSSSNTTTTNGTFGLGGGGGSVGYGWCNCGGGGGGYSGGGSGNINQSGGGGGSFNAGLNQVNMGGTQTGHGEVVITEFITNSAPTIIAVPQTIASGSVQNLLIATATDAEDAENQLSLSLTTPNPANGVTLSNITVDSAGNVIATVAADLNSPCSGATATFGLKVTDTVGAMATTTETITVSSRIVTLGPTSLPNGVQGIAYNQNVVANPAGIYNYVVTTNSLPPGLLLDSATGAITGTPSAAGNYTFVITASSGPCSASRSYNLAITNTCGTITVNPTTLLPGTHGAAYSVNITATGGVAPYTFSLLSGALPGGLTLDASGLLSGTPTATGTFVITIRATGQGGCTGQRSYVLTINCGTVTIDTVLPNPVKGVAYSQTLTASPLGTYTFNVQTGSLPPGLTLNSAGVLSGVTNTTGTYTFTVRARTASGCQGTRTYTLTVLNP